MKCSKNGCLVPACRMEVIRDRHTNAKASHRYCIHHLNLSRYLIPIWIVVNHESFEECTYKDRDIEAKIYKIGDND